MVVVSAIEQELERIIEGSDYCVKLSVTSYLHVHVVYAPSFRVASSRDGEFSYVANSGEIAVKLFSGPPRWRYWRARRFIRRTITAHRKLLAEGVLVA